MSACDIPETDPEWQNYCSIRNQNDVNEILSVTATPDAKAPTVTKYEVELLLVDGSTSTVETFLDNELQFYLHSSAGYCIASTTGAKSKVLQESGDGIFLE